MKNFALPTLVIVCLIALVKPAKAQYPKIPPALQDSTDAVMKNVVQKHSDEAWAKALPIVQADATALAKNGGGYTNIEVYLDSVVPIQTVVPSKK